MARGGMRERHGESWDSQSSQLLLDLRLSIRECGGAGWRGLRGWLFHWGGLAKFAVCRWREHA